MVARERVQRDLREYERTFRKLTENASEGFWISDPEFEAVYVNPAFEEIWGRPREQLYGDPETMIEGIHPEDRGRIERAIGEMVETGEFDEIYRVQRPNGETRWVHDRGFPVRNDDGTVTNLAGTATDITERKHIGTELRRQRDRTELILDTTPVTILVFDAERTVTFGNEHVTEVLGPEDIAGTPFSELPWELLENGDPVPDGCRPFDIVRERNEPVYDLQYPALVDGERRWLSVNGAPLYDDGEFSGAVFAVEDITDRKRREEVLTALQETSREMIRADSRAAVYDVAVAAASDLLAFPRVACYRLERGGYALEPAAHSADAAGFVEEHGRIENGGPIWEAFVGGTPEQDGGITAVALGSHGVLALLEDGVTEESLSLARVLCATAEAALDRTDREGVVEAQSEELRRTNDELERLTHVADLVRDVTAALIRATSREEIATTVCERLAAADRYRFAWIGDDRGHPTAWAGITESALAGIEREEADYEPPAVRALRTGEPSINRELLESAPPDQRADALSKDYRSAVAVPLAHRDRTYGVLSVYADRAAAFGGDEREVLSELGRTVGYAINAVEMRNTLTSDGVTELRFSIRDSKTLPAVLAAGTHLEHRGIVPRADGSIRWFVTVDAPIDRMRSTAAEIGSIERVQPVVTEGTTLLECVVHPPCLLSAFVEHGVAITELTASGAETTVTVEAADADVRSLCGTLESRYDAELIGKRTLDRPPQTPEERYSGVAGDLTDRQHEILEIAYLSGYFETPRRITGAELAERLGINRSTFHRTLRAAEQATFDALLE